MQKKEIYLILRSAQLCIVASLARQFPGLKVVGEEGEQVMILMILMRMLLIMSMMMMMMMVMMGLIGMIMIDLPL